VADVVALMPALVDEFAAKAQRQRDDVDRLAADAHALAKGQLPQPATEPGVDSDAGQQGLDAGGLDHQLLEIFRNEADSHLKALVGFLADCAQQLPQPVTDNLQRALHTLKGSAHMAGVLPIAEIRSEEHTSELQSRENLV